MPWSLDGSTIVGRKAVGPLEGVAYVEEVGQCVCVGALGHPDPVLISASCPPPCEQLPPPPHVPIAMMLFTKRI